MSTRKHASSVKLRQLERRDLPTLKAIFQNEYKEVTRHSDYGIPLRLRKPTSKELEERIEDAYKSTLSHDNFYYVIEADGKIAGICNIVKKDIPDSEMSHVGILGITILEKYRGMGLGTKLMKYALEHCRNQFKIIELSVFASNEAAKRIYEKFGFKTWGIAPGYVKRGRRYIDMEYMYLKL
ncbi:MAG: GNAT family N-acetyltransferase [Candidatus Marsarchaeota archaeon]|jgi:RimJ/RimL family protein N-acetyltransferase|nr:GNAT family N-acetyltransferase [Candidatus Marsarchaeota archaeon]